MTNEQIKEFWEWCGFEYKIPSDYGLPCCDWWQYPDGIQSSNSPPIDLNNLFKYAVPKLDYCDITKPETPKGWWVSSVRIEVNNRIVFGHKIDKDPALALFWAIWEVMK